MAATDEVHASVRAAARVMDVDVLAVPTDDRGRMTGAALDAAIDDARQATGVFAVVATGGTTNAGAIDELDAIADVCAARGLWLHVDGAYGLAALCSDIARAAVPRHRARRQLRRRPAQVAVRAVRLRGARVPRPAPAAAAHAQHGDYLDAIDRGEWNPSDYAYHLSRRARGLPLWFSLATYGTRAYTEAVDTALAHHPAVGRRRRRPPGVHAAARARAVGGAVHRRRVDPRPVPGAGAERRGPRRRRPGGAHVVAGRAVPAASASSTRARPLDRRDRPARRPGDGTSW